MDMQAIRFFATESTSNLQASLNYIMVSCLKKSCFRGSVACFSYLSRMLWPTKQNAYLTALGL